MGERGFTIVEALTAMAILAVSLTALYGAGADALSVGAHVAQIDRAVLVAQTKLEELSLVSEPLPAHDEGTAAEKRFTWSMSATEISEIQMATGRRVLQAVTLDVHWRDGLRSRTISVETRHLGAASP